MIQNKKVTGFAIVMMVLALAASTFFIGLGNTQAASGVIAAPEYAEKVFGTDILSVEILADEKDWQEMLDNASSEQFIMVDVTVNGVKFQNVGIRPKGNSSLSQVASNPDSDRYSFRLQFDEYISGQTCFGLQSLVLNNMIGDYTYMKEYVSYDIMQEIGVDAPYFSFADIKLNGESWGFYLAVETYNEGYELRTFGTTAGMLYNVKSMEMGDREEVGEEFSNRIPRGGGEAARQMPEGGEFMRQIPQDGNAATVPQRGNAPGGNMGGFGSRGGSGGDLSYSDDDSASYSSIFNNAVGKSTESDYQRVITALKALTENRDLEAYLDVDQILRYLAAHTLVVNLDSYSSSMAQNYYIYENDGKITILPWDYNYAWGGFQSGSASSVVNFPIDTPVSGIEMESRPLINNLLANPEYLNRYHSYLQELMDTYFANGKFEAKVNALNTLIESYVKNDATAFYTYEQYKTSVSAFVTLGSLRAESIQGQLNGTVPSTTAEQTANPSKLIATDGLNLSDLGTSMGGRNGGSPDMTNLPNESRTETELPNRQAPSLMPPGTIADEANNTLVNSPLFYGIMLATLAGAILFTAKRSRNF